MKQFADKINDSPSDKSKDTTSDKTSDTSSDKKNGSSSGKTKDTPSSGKTNDSPSDKHSDSPADKSNNRPSDKPSDSSSPSDDNNGAVIELRSNTTERVSSDEEDSNHEVTKRSTPLVRVVTTQDPSALRNVSVSSNSTVPIPVSTQPTVSNQPSANTTTATDSQESQQNNDTSASLHSGSSGFSKELMDFFRTDSSESANSGGKSKAKSEANVANVPLTPQEFIQRFQTGVVKQLSQLSTDTSSNETQVVSPTATAQSTTSPVNKDAIVTQMSDRVGGPSVQAVLNTVGKDSIYTTPNDAWVVSSDSIAEHTTTTSDPGGDATATGQLFEQGTTAVTGSQTHVSSSSNDSQPLHQQSGPSVSSRDGVQTSTKSPLPATTTDSSSEEATTDSSSVEHTDNTTASPTSVRDKLGLFFDANLANAASGFQQRFGSSSNTTTPPTSTTSTAASSSAERNLIDVSAEDTTTDGLPTGTSTPSDSSEDLFGDLISTTSTSSSQANTVQSTGFPDTSKQAARPQPSGSASAHSGETTATSAESGEVSTTAAYNDAGSSRAAATTTPDSSSSEERSQPPGQPQGTTLAKLRDVLDSITPSPGHVAPPAGHSWMSLRQCQSKHQFVCAAKPVEGFLPGELCFPCLVV